MLLKLGKSLIVVTVVTTATLVVLVMSPTSTTMAIRSDLLRSEIGGGQDAVTFIALGSSFAFIAVLLILMAIKGRNIGTKSEQEAESPTASSQIEGQNSSRPERVLPSAEDFHMLGTLKTVAEPHRKTERWKDESLLVGNTLRIYWSLLCRKHNPVGIRTIQRELGFSSPSSAVYQLEKLMKLGLVEKDSMGDYVVRKAIKVGFLRYFFFIGGYPLPKSAIYGTITLLIDVACLVSLIGLQIEILIAGLASLPGLFSSSIFWYDAVRTLKYKQVLI